MISTCWLASRKFRHYQKIMNGLRWNFIEDPPTMIQGTDYIFGIVWITMLTHNIGVMHEQSWPRRSVLSECSCLNVFYSEEKEWEWYTVNQQILACYYLLTVACNCSSLVWYILAVLEALFHQYPTKPASHLSTASHPPATPDWSQHQQNPRQ